MRKPILIVAANIGMASVARVLASHNLKVDDVVIVTPENVDQMKEEIASQRPFEREPIKIEAMPPMDEYVPTRKELEKHPFEKFMGRKGKKC